MNEKVITIGPDDPRNIPQRLAEHHREMSILATSLETMSEAERLAVLQSNPQLREHLEYEAAQRSVVDARRHAESIAHTIFIQ